MGEAALAHEPEYYHTDMPVGEILRRAREHYGQSLPDIERALRIRAIQIEAIEKNDLARLPGRVYAVGFVRSYAEYLGLDGDKMVSLFKKQSNDPGRKPQLHFPVAASESKIPALWMVGASLLVAIILMIGWSAIRSDDRTLVTELQDVPDELRARMEPEIYDLNAGEKLGLDIEGPPAPSDLNAAAPAAGDSTAPVSETATAEPGIIINIKENSWVEILDAQGKAIVSKVLKAGDQYFVPDRPGLVMSIGNAAGVEIVVDGEILPPLGKTGDIKRNIPLDSQALKAAN